MATDEIKKLSNKDLLNLLVAKTADVTKAQMGIGSQEQTLAQLRLDLGSLLAENQRRLNQKETDPTVQELAFELDMGGGGKEVNFVRDIIKKLGITVNSNFGRYDDETGGMGIIISGSASDLEKFRKLLETKFIQMLLKEIGLAIDSDGGKILLSLGKFRLELPG